MAKIVQKEDKILRSIAKEVPISEIKSKKVQKIISDMKALLAKEPDGVAIAAPQIGVPFRIFVVSGKVKSFLEKTEKEYPDSVYINPKITKLSKDKKLMEEGCLSVRYLYGKVRRSNKASIEAYDENGKFFKRGASGLLAQIFQHECDHLDGILFIDKAKDLEEMPMEVWEEQFRQDKTKK